MIVMRIKLYRGSSGALRAEFADGLDSVSQNNAGSNVVEVVPDKSVALSENEVLRIGYATSINENDPNTLNVGFTIMPFYPENGVWRAFVPPLVCKTRGKWLLNLQVVSDWDDETEEIQYISHTVEPLEFSVKAVIQDGSGNYPNVGDILALYEEARRLENATGRLEEKTEAIVEVQKALEDKIKEFNGNLSGADARLQAEANGEVTIATIEINNPNTTLAFKNLEGMTEIDWGDGTINSELTHTYENLGVYYCRIYGLVSIGEEAFKGSIPSSNYTPITHIKISNKVTSIGDNAFTYTKLRSIEIPNSVTYIGSSFDSSHYLEKIVIPESVTYIDVDAFNMCANLKIVEFKGAPPQQIYSGDIFSFADKLEKIIVPYGMVEAYKSASAWSDYATLIDCLVYQSDLDVSKAEIKEKITENREEINKDIKNLYAITAQGGLYTMLEVEQAFSSRETADGESIVDGQYTAPTKIQGSTVAYENVLKNAYFKGIKSTGKNLFNPERELSSFSATLNTSLRDFDETKVYVGMSNNNYVNLSAVTNVSYIDGIFSFTTTNNAGYGVGVPIKVKPDTQYSVSYRLITGSNVVLGIGFYNKNGALIEYSYSEKTFTTPIDCAWVLLVISNNLAGSISYTDIQLEESSAATAYEPYKEDTYELSEAVELPFGDTLDVKNQKIINNGYTEVINIANKSCVQTGTNWQRDGFFSFYALAALSKMGKLGAPHRITAICTNGFSQGGWQFDDNTFENGTERYILTGNENNILYVIMPNSDLGVTQEDTDEVKIAAAKEWFANNSVTVRYITVDTTETSIETPERYQAWKNGSETVVQGDTDNSEYGAMPTVTTEYFKLTEV